MQSPSTSGSPTPRRPRLAALGRSRRLPLALLLLGLAVAGVAAWQAARTVRRHQETSERLLGGYAAFAAWSFRQHAAEELDHAFHGLLEPVVHAGGQWGDTAVTPDALVALDADPSRTQMCAAGVEEALLFCAADPGAPWFFRVPLGGGAPTFAGELPGEGVRRWAADAVRAHAAGVRRPGWEFSLVRGTLGGGERLLVYALAGPDAAPVAYGFELDGARFARLLDTLLATRPLLPDALTRGRPSRELLGVRLLSPSGEALSASPGAGGPRTSSDTLDAALGRLVAEATILPAATRALAGGAFDAPRLPLLGGLLLLAVVLGAVALRQLRREAELARLRSDFVSSVSHELRTPLAQVQLFLDTLRAGRWRTDEQREWILDNMQRETARLTGLVNNVLHFSRGERGDAGGPRAPVDLGEYVAGVVAGFAPLAASRRVRLDVVTEPGVMAPLHEESFRQVLLNLLDNAVKYGPEGQRVRVGVSLREARARVTVSDEGPGVEPAERARIWEPFRRGRQAVGSVAVGSGIGLAVAREIVEWHEGAVWVEGAAGGGACFVVELPGWRAGGGAPATAALDVLQPGR